MLSQFSKITSPGSHALSRRPFVPWGNPWVRKVENFRGILPELNVGKAGREPSLRSLRLHRPTAGLEFLGEFLGAAWGEIPVGSFRAKWWEADRESYSWASVRLRSSAGPKSWGTPPGILGDDPYGKRLPLILSVAHWGMKYSGESNFTLWIIPINSIRVVGINCQIAWPGGIVWILPAFRLPWAMLPRGRPSRASPLLSVSLPVPLPLYVLGDHFRGWVNRNSGIAVRLPSS